MQGTDPNRLDELASLVSPFGQPRDSHHRRAADRYAPQIRIVKGDVPVSPRSPSSSRSGAPARTSLHRGGTSVGHFQTAAQLITLPPVETVPRLQGADRTPPVDPMGA